MFVCQGKLLFLLGCHLLCVLCLLFEHLILSNKEGNLALLVVNLVGKRLHLLLMMMVMILGGLSYIIPLGVN